MERAELWIQYKHLLTIWKFCCAVVVNRDGKLEEAVEHINTIITAEKQRTSRIRWQDADVAQQAEQQQEGAQPERQPSLQC